MPPELTVLLPVRDAQAHLQQALDSLSGQSFGDWACLAWDDGSRDGSRAVLEAHAARDSRFQVLGARAAPAGVAVVLNALLSRVATPWVARMDADDVCLPARFAEQRRAAREAPEISLWSGLVEPLGAAAGSGWESYLAWLNSAVSPDQIRREAFTECPLPHPTWYTRGALLASIGGYRDGPFPEDYDLFLRLLRRGARFGKVPETVLRWRDHPGRQTRTSPRLGRDAFLRLKARHFGEGWRAGELRHLPDRPLAVWGAGKTGRILVRELAACGVTPDGFVDPLKGGQTAAGLPVLSPEASPPGRHLLLVAVGPRPLRDSLTERFRGEGREFGRDYLWLF